MYFCTEFILNIRKAMKSYLMNSITCLAICSMTAMVSCTQKQEPVDPILSHIDDSFVRKTISLSMPTELGSSSIQFLLLSRAQVFLLQLTILFRHRFIKSA